MECSNCGNKAAYRLHVSEHGECCDQCGSVPTTTVHDVFFRQPYLDPHLIDTSKPEQKNGVWIETRSQKAQLMRKLGVKEMGDYHHGARPTL